MSDRRTSIGGDQITDNTITPNEFKTSNSPGHKKVLTWDGAAQIMKWIKVKRGKLGV